MTMFGKKIHLQAVCSPVGTYHPVCSPAGTYHPVCSPAGTYQPVYQMRADQFLRCVYWKKFHKGNQQINKLLTDNNHT